MEHAHFAAALGLRELPHIVLDASVAIPLLSARLFEAADLGFFIAAGALTPRQGPTTVARPRNVSQS